MQSDPALSDFIVGFMRGQPPGMIIRRATIHAAILAGGFEVSYKVCRGHLGVLVLDGFLEKDPGGLRGYRLL